MCQEKFRSLIGPAALSFSLGETGNLWGVCIGPPGLREHQCDPGSQCHGEASACAQPRVPAQYLRSFCDPGSRWHRCWATYRCYSGMLSITTVPLVKGRKNAFFHCALLEEEMATRCIFLPGKSHGQRSPVGYSPWGRKESRHGCSLRKWKWNSAALFWLR